MFVLLSIGRYHCWWTISLCLYYYPSVDGPLYYYPLVDTWTISLWTISLHDYLYYYPSVDTTAGGLLVYVCIIIHRSIPLLVDYCIIIHWSMFVLLSIGRYHCWWTISLYYYPSVDTTACIIIHRSIPLLVDY